MGSCIGENVELVNHICNVLKDRNIIDIKIIPLKHSFIASYIIIGSGTSKRQMISAAEFLYSELKQKHALIEKGDESSWILLATDDIIVHLFKPEVREEYNLEALYDETPNERVSEQEKAAKKLSNFL